MAKTTLREFNVYAWVQVLTDTKIRAASLTEAVEQASKLKETDFVTLSGDYCDGSIVIEGIYEIDARSRLGDR